MSQKGKKRSRGKAGAQRGGTGKTTTSTSTSESTSPPKRTSPSKSASSEKNPPAGDARGGNGGGRRGGGNGNGGNGNGGNGRRNHRVISGVSADTLLGYIAKRVYSAAVANGQTSEQVPALLGLAPLAELGMNLSEELELELFSTVKTLEILFGLKAPGIDLLLFSLACELDERIYVTALHLTAGVPGAAGPRVGGLLSLLYRDLNDRSQAHQSLLDDAPLMRYKLVRLLGPRNSPISQQELCAEPSFLQHIVRSGAPAFPPIAPPIAGVGSLVGPADADIMDGEVPVDLGHYLDLLLANPGPVQVFHLRLQTTRIAESVAKRIAYHVDRPVVVLDIRAIDDNHEDKVAVALREARLRNGIPLFVNPLQMNLEDDKNSIVRKNAQHWLRMLAHETGLVIMATEEPESADVDMLLSFGLELSSYEFPKLSINRRRELFEVALDTLQADTPGGLPRIEVSDDVSSEYLATVHRVTEVEISAIVKQAASDARLRSLVEGVEPTVTADDMQRAAREKTYRDVGKFARLVTSHYRWKDLILPADVKQQLADIYISAKKRAYVYEEWGYKDKHARGLSLAVMFSGESGTGKTMAAEVLATELGVNLYQVDLSSVVSKWVGETERHLQQIFDATENSDSVLFFDEADSLFGKRTQVNESKDRYANIEVSYLLQRIENYSGIVVLSTNLRSNIDKAFLRRLQYGIRFPKPDQLARKKIWMGAFPPTAPIDMLDYEELSNRWEDLSGGQIRLIAVGAAMLAAGEGKPLDMTFVERAYNNERDKMLRVVVNSEEDQAKASGPAPELH